MPAPGQAGYPGPAYTYPGYSGPIPAQPGYGAPAAPYSGYPAPTYAYPGYSTPAYSYPGYNTPTPAYPGSGAPAYAYAPGYGYYPWPMAAPRPRRDTYLLVVGIIAFACSCLTILGGLLSLGFMLLVSAIPNPQSTSDQLFSGLAVFLALAIVGLVGGGFCTYHSMRSLFFKKPSRHIWLPYFWAFLLCYLAILGLGSWLNAQGQGITSPQLKGLLIYLSAILPALAVLALGIRRLRFSLRDQWLTFRQSMIRRFKAPAGTQPFVGGLPHPAGARVRGGQWPTSWRRLVLALVSGATLSIILASILEFVIQLILVGSQSAALSRVLNDPNYNPSPSLYSILLIMLAVVAPIVEELVKPLAVVILIGRVKSKAEAFALGLACGIGFNLVETTGYISSGTGGDWLHIALIRSGAGLLHGFGAAMMALGWYIFTHKEEGRWARRILLGLSCGLYAMFQHAIWNGSVGLLLIPGPIGNFFQNGNLTFGVLDIHAYEFVNIAELIAMAIFFIYMAGALRVRPLAPSQTPVEQAGQPQSTPIVST